MLFLLAYAAISSHEAAKLIPFARKAMQKLQERHDTAMTRTLCSHLIHDVRQFIV